MCNERRHGQEKQLYYTKLHRLCQIWKQRFIYTICTSLLGCLIQTTLIFHSCCDFDCFQFWFLFSSFSASISRNSISNAWYMLLISVHISSTHHTRPPLINCPCNRSDHRFCSSTLLLWPAFIMYWWPQLSIIYQLERWLLSCSLYGGRKRQQN